MTSLGEHSRKRPEFAAGKLPNPRLTTLRLDDNRRDYVTLKVRIALRKTAGKKRCSNR